VTLSGYFCDGISTSTYFPCPQGFYCPAGTGIVLPRCPIGTYAHTDKLTAASDCTQCDPGSFCSQLGLTAPETPCAAGYVCEQGSEDEYGTTPTNPGGYPCPLGHHCPASSSAGTPCPPSTFNPSFAATSTADCLYCTPGSFCATYGLPAPTGPCAAGYVCPLGSATATPSSTSLTSGYAPPDGLTIGGYQAPQGTYSLNGSHVETACDAGTYQPNAGNDFCHTTPPGYYTPTSSVSYVSYEGSPGYHYPAGTKYRTEFPCPPGTYSNKTGNQDIADCQPAPPGYYSEGPHNTEPTGMCAEGFFCLSASFSATPACVPVAFDPVTNVTTCDTGGPCVASQYCPVGSSYAQPCPGGHYCADSSGKITGETYAGFFGAYSMSSPAPYGVYVASERLPFLPLPR
jgi:hypothetical protein